MDLDEMRRPAPNLVAHRAIRRDRRSDGHDPVAGQHRRDPSDAADVLVAVGLREPEPLRKVLAHLVAVEQLDLAAPRPQVVDHDVRDRALARPREAGEPEATTRQLHGAAGYGKHPRPNDVGPVVSRTLM